MRKTASLVSDYNAEFEEIIAREFPDLEGRQVPQELFAISGGDASHGEKAIELARRFGVNLMPWQRDQVILALSTDREGKWLHSDIVLICPRQNGKSLVLEVIILYRLFVLHHQIVFSAQQWRTAKSIRNRLWKRIKNRAWAAKRLVRNTASAGEAEMETAQGGKIQFSTRSNDMGRGFDQIDLLMIDEAYNLDAGELDAVSPTQLAADDPQTYFTSSAVNRDLHPKGEYLSELRQRALSGDSRTMLFAEFCAPPGMNADDPLTWALGNPSYGIVSTEKKVRSQREKLSEVGFEVEMLGWGRWFERQVDAEADQIIDLDLWAARTAQPSGIGDCAIGVDVTPDGERVGMVSAVAVGEDVFLSLAPYLGFERGEVVGGIIRTARLNDPLAVVMDSTGECSTLVRPLEDGGLEPVIVSGGQVSKAWALFKRLWLEGRIFHDGNPRWAESWAVAAERSRGGQYVSLDRYCGDVSLLVAASLAVWGLQEFALPDVIPEFKKKTKFVGSAKSVKSSGRSAAGRVFEVSHAAF